jgi:hypothetical protein
MPKYAVIFDGQDEGPQPIADFKEIKTLWIRNVKSFCRLNALTVNSQMKVSLATVKNTQVYIVPEIIRVVTDNGAFFVNYF